MLSLSAYPEITLKDAREKRDAAKKLLIENQDPGEVKKAQKLAAIYGDDDSFEYVVREWIENNSQVWLENHSNRVARRLEQYVFPWIGKRKMSQLTPPELLAIARRLEKRGVLETAKRVMALCGQVFRYAVGTGRTERDITVDLRGTLAPVKEKHLASITDPKLKTLWEIASTTNRMKSYDEF